jgi:ArsR family transcriptional regulator
MKQPYTQKELNDAAEVIRAIAHPLRLRIIRFIDKNRKINVNKIYNKLKLEQSTTSQHLRILREAELVNADRDGKFIYYSLNYERLKQLSNSVDDFFAKAK